MEIKPIKVNSINDLPEAPVSQGVTLIRKTGTWKNVRPVISERSAPCENACPLKIRIPKFIDYLTKSESDKAGLEILKWNPFPSITGRVCPAKCETGCNRNKYDEKISIRELERFLGDLILEKKRIEIKGQKTVKVAVYGTSTSLMAAVYRLSEGGFKVVVFTKGQRLFSDVRDSIPEDILKKEEKVLNDAGLEIITDKAPSIQELKNTFNYILLSSADAQNMNIVDTKVGKTEDEKIFVVTEEQDIARSIKNGLSVALYLTSKEEGKEYQEERLPRVVSYKEIITDYFNHEKAIPEIRTLDEAIKEAFRCFSCGTCNSCGNCYVFCPDSAVKWIDNFPSFDYDYCKGCGVCVNECPRGVLELVPEK
uniref:4Fe-4S ferredoxin-type domain-containing protein n=1 Tax=candidate division WOR-3 bacterium TaxID=2052148 RepID=A0A7V3ZXQ3_UNCW3